MVALSLTLHTAVVVASVHLTLRPHLFHLILMDDTLDLFPKVDGDVGTTT